MDETVTMTCLTMKKNFDVVNPEVVVLKNGRYAYRARCPWEGKGGKTLYAFKFCGTAAHERDTARNEKQKELGEEEGDCINPNSDGEETSYLEDE